MIYGHRRRIIAVRNDNWYSCNPRYSHCRCVPLLPGWSCITVGSPTVAIIPPSRGSRAVTWSVSQRGVWSAVRHFLPRQLQQTTLSTWTRGNPVAPDVSDWHRLKALQLLFPPVTYFQHFPFCLNHFWFGYLYLLVVLVVLSPYNIRRIWDDIGWAGKFFTRKSY